MPIQLDVHCGMLNLAFIADLGHQLCLYIHYLVMEVQFLVLTSLLDASIQFWFVLLLYVIV